MRMHFTGKKLGEPGGNRTLDPRIKSPNPGVRLHPRSSEYARSYPVFGGLVSDLVRLHPDLSGPIVDESVDAIRVSGLSHGAGERQSG